MITQQEYPEDCLVSILDEINMLLEKPKKRDQKKVQHLMNKYNTIVGEELFVKNFKI